MTDAELAFLNSLLNTPSPSGYERAIQDVVRAFARSFADEVRTDSHGNVIAAVNPGGSPRIMLAGHCDQIGLMVKYIDDSGFLWLDAIGGWDMQMLVGQNLVVWTTNGPVRGVMARKAVHLLTPEEKKKVPELKDLWLDIGARDREHAQSLVSVGDAVTFELGMRRLQGDLAAAAGMDNKVGAWTVMNALRLVSELSPRAAVFAVSTVQEELGLRGAQTAAFSIEADVGIAVDVTHATDCPTLDKKQYGDVKLGAGPVVFRGPNVNPHVGRMLLEQAGRKERRIQIGGLSRPAGNDANVIQISRGGVATGIVAIPNRYMHSPVEVISLGDLSAAAALIADFCAAAAPDSVFTP
jgi:endoglucanase